MALNFSLTKKSGAEPVAVSLWHPDFRDVTRLPDTKVVRTAFFVNTAAIAAAIALLLLLGYREFALRELQDKTLTTQQQIDANNRQNAEAIKLSQAFAAEQKKLAELSAFQSSPVLPTEYIALLAQTLPPEILIDNANMRQDDTGKAAIFQLRALVAGSPDQASGAASRYVDKLRENQRLTEIFDQIALTNLSRDTSGGFLSVDISLRVKTASATK
jgi:hypothetical protein